MAPDTIITELKNEREIVNKFQEAFCKDLKLQQVSQAGTVNRTLLIKKTLNGNPL